MLAVAGAMATTVMADPGDAPIGTGPSATETERVLLKANIIGNGQIAGTYDGTDPEFGEDPMQSIGVNVIPGESVNLKAKADDGWKFEGWKNAADGKIVFTEESYTVTVNEATELVAVFGLDEEESGSGNSNGQNNDSGSGQGTAGGNGGNGGNGGTAPYTPATGDTASAAALAAVAAASLGAAVLGMKRRKEND